MKKSMSIVDIYAWVKASGSLIEKCYINNIYHPYENVILLKLYCKHLSYNPMLLMEAGKRIHLTKYSIPKEHKISPLCSALRKLLRRSIIEKLEILDWERIVKITVTLSKQKYFIYVELLPRGVIVLTDENNKILHTTRTLELKDRVIRRGREYKLPPTLGINVLEASPEEVKNAVSKYKKIIQGLVRGLGLPGEVAEEICFRAGIDKNISPKQLPMGFFSKIINTVKDVIQESEKNIGYVVLEEEKAVTVLPFEPKHLLVKGFTLKTFDNFNEALDFFFSEKLREEKAIEAIRLKEKELRKIEHALEEAKKLREEYRSKAMELRQAGELILKNRELLDRVIECFRSREIRRKGEEAVKICSEKVKRTGIRILSFNRKNGTIILQINGKEVSVDFRKNAYENASSKFEKARELERKISRINEKIKELHRKIEELKYETKLLEAEEKAKIRRKEWYEKYHWVVEENYLIIGGRNADQNESIVKKYMESNDIFMHAEIHGAPVVVIKAKGTVSEKALREAAIIAAAYSKAWKEGLGAIDVYWVWGRQVSKKPPSGEYLPKGAFMIYGKRNYIRDIPLTLALGLEKVNSWLRIIVGSEEHVKNKSIAYVTLAPGHISPHSLAKIIKEELIKKVPEKLKPLIKSISVEELALRIPGPSVIGKIVINI